MIWCKLSRIPSSIHNPPDDGRSHKHNDNSSTLLLCVAAELRLEIYRLLFKGLTVIWFGQVARIYETEDLEARRPDHDKHTHGPTLLKFPLALLLACRQIHREAALAIFKHSRFKPSPCSLMLTDCLSNILPAKKHAIRNV